MTSVTAVTIHNLERETYEPKISTLKELCAALSVPLDYFLEDTTDHLFVRVRPTRRGILASRSTIHPALPEIQRLELESGSTHQIKAKSDTIITVYLIFGRLEASSGNLTRQLIAGDALHAELLLELNLTALEPSLVINIIHQH